jgi:hypothetical protein
MSAPPSWMTRLLGRPLSRALLLFRTAWGERPDLLMGYHIIPNSLLCLVALRFQTALSSCVITLIGMRWE